MVKTSHGRTDGWTDNTVTVFLTCMMYHNGPVTHGQYITFFQDRLKIYIRIIITFPFVLKL